MTSTSGLLLRQGDATELINDLLGLCNMPPSDAVVDSTLALVRSCYPWGSITLEGAPGALLTTLEAAAASHPSRREAISTLLDMLLQNSGACLLQGAPCTCAATTGSWTLFLLARCQIATE